MISAIGRRATVAKPRCVIIDESLMVRRVAGRIIRELGYEVIEADSGKDALPHCAPQPPQVILMDWQLGDMDGAAFITQLTSQLDGQSLPKILFCTADRRIDRIKQALSLGVIEYIMKPFDSDIIESKFRLSGLPISSDKGAASSKPAMAS